MQEESYITWSPLQLSGVYLEDLYRILESFKNSTEILSGHQYPTLSCLGSILVDLKEKIEQKDEDSRAVKLVKAAIDEDLNQRYMEPSYEHCFILRPTF